MKRKVGRPRNVERHEFKRGKTVGFVLTLFLVFAAALIVTYAGKMFGVLTITVGSPDPLAMVLTIVGVFGAYVFARKLFE